MSYTLRLSSGGILVQLPDTKLDQVTTSLSLVGKNFPGYGTYINQNFVSLLENFASDTGPNSPLLGQLWYDTTRERLFVYSKQGNQTLFYPVGAPVYASAPTGQTTPTGLGNGDLWFDATNKQLKFYDGTTVFEASPLTLSLTVDITGVSTSTVNTYLISYLDEVYPIQPSDPRYNISPEAVCRVITQNVSYSSSTVSVTQGIVEFLADTLSWVYNRTIL